MKKNAVPANCQSLVWYAKELYPEMEIIPMADTHICMDAVKEKKVDAVFQNTYVLAQYRHEDRTLDIEPFLSPRSQLALSLGMGESKDPALRTLLNKLIDQLPTRSVNEIVVKNTMNGPQIHPWQFIRTIILPLAAAVLLVILIILVRSRKKVEQIAFTDPLTRYGIKHAL